MNCLAALLIKHLQSQLADHAIYTSFLLAKEYVPFSVPWQDLIAAAKEEFQKIALYAGFCSGRHGRGKASQNVFKPGPG
ncbi:hypothetical protein CIAM_45840 (plasmid) [Citrobacter amalonaticus]|nr:hypothetical protein CIAM_45840 [Citrobacter amalonaticus]